MVEVEVVATGREARTTLVTYAFSLNLGVKILNFLQTLVAGGRYWTRTSDLLLVRQALSPTELIAPFPGEMVRLAGARTHDLCLRRAALYPTELQAHYRRRHSTVRYFNYRCRPFPVLVPKVGFEPTRPRGTLRPERSASAVPPLRPLTALSWWAILDSNQ